MKETTILDAMPELRSHVQAKKDMQNPMTMEQYEAVRRNLEDTHRGFAVNANKFDTAMPYRVSVKKDSTWHNYGSFSDIDVAAAIGTICSIAHYGHNAVKGAYDLAKVKAHAEFKTWMTNPKNVDVLTQYKTSVQAFSA